MKKLLLLLFLPTLSFADRLGSLRSGADVLLTTQAVAGNMSPGATYYINVTSSLQSGATFYVSSGTVAGKFIIKSTDTFYLLNPTANQNFSYHTTTLPSNGGVGPQIVYDFLHSRQTTDSGLVGGFYLQGSTQTYESFTSGGSGDRAALVLQAPVGTSSGSVNITLKDAVRSFSFDKNGISDIGLPSGQCVQTGTGGLLTVTGSACGSGGGGSGIVSPGSFTWTNNYGASFSTVSVSTLSVAGNGLLMATENGFTGQILIATGTPTSGQALIAASSWSVVATPLRSTILAVDSNGILISTTVAGGAGGGATGGNIVASPQYQVPYYSLSGTTTTITGASNFTNDGSTITISLSSMTARQVTFDYVGSSLTISSVTLPTKNASRPAVIDSNFNLTDGQIQLASANHVNGILQTASVPGLTGDVTSSDGSLATTAAALQNNITTFGSSITVNGSNLGSRYGVTASSVAVTSATVSGQTVTTGITVNELTASRPMLSDANKKLTSGQIDFGNTNHITGTLAAAQFPALTGDITTSAGNLATTLATTIANAHTFTGPITHNTSSTTFNAAIQVSTSILLNGDVGTAGEVLTSGGPGTVPTWATPSGGSGDMILASTQTVTGRKVFQSSTTFEGGIYVSSSVLLSGSVGSAGQALLSAGPGAIPTWGSPSAGGAGSSGNITWNNGGTAAGILGSNVSGNTIIISTGGINSYKVVLSSTEVNIGSFTVNSGMFAVNGVSTMTVNAALDLTGDFYLNGTAGTKGDILKSHGSGETPKWISLMGRVTAAMKGFNAP